MYSTRHNAGGRDDNKRAVSWRRRLMSVASMYVCRRWHYDADFHSIARCYRRNTTSLFTFPTTISSRLYDADTSRPRSASCADCSASERRFSTTSSRALSGIL